MPRCLRPLDWKPFCKVSQLPQTFQFFCPPSCKKKLKYPILAGGVRFFGETKFLARFPQNNLLRTFLRVTFSTPDAHAASEACAHMAGSVGSALSPFWYSFHRYCFSRRGQSYPGRVRPLCVRGKRMRTKFRISLPPFSHTFAAASSDKADAPVRPRKIRLKDSG